MTTAAAPLWRNHWLFHHRSRTHTHTQTLAHINIGMEQKQHIENNKFKSMTLTLHCKPCLQICFERLFSICFGSKVHSATAQMSNDVLIRISHQCKTGDIRGKWTIVRTNKKKKVIVLPLFLCIQMFKNILGMASSKITLLFSLYFKLMSTNFKYEFADFRKCFHMICKSCDCSDRSIINALNHALENRWASFVKTLFNWLESFLNVMINSTKIQCVP